MTPLPAFHADPSCPPLPAEGSGIAIVTSGDGPIAEVLVHGSYRVAEADRARLGPARVRHQVWLVAIHRQTRLARWARAAGDAVEFGEEEPARGPITGWFHVALAATLGIPENDRGLYDVIAALGPFRAPSQAVTLRR